MHLENEHNVEMDDGHFDIGSTDFVAMPLQRLAVIALATARARDVPRFQALLEGISDRDDYMKAETTITDTLLANDELAMYKGCFELGYLADWCKNHTGHVVRHCPQVLQCWADPSTGVRTSTVHARIADVLECMPESAKAALLQGKSADDGGGFEDTTAHQMLHRYLEHARYHWRVVSPHWIGAPGSPLRQAAIDLGWQARYLPPMIRRNVFGATAGEWLGRIPYAYSMLACEEYTHAETWAHHTPQESDIVVGAASSDPVDIAMAQAIFKRHEQPKHGIVLRRHRATPVLDTTTLKKIDHFVEAHAIMGTLTDLAQSLAHGVVPHFGVHETLALPDLDGMEP